MKPLHSVGVGLCVLALMACSDAGDGASLTQDGGGDVPQLDARDGEDAAAEDTATPVVPDTVEADTAPVVPDTVEADTAPVVPDTVEADAAEPDTDPGDASDPDTDPGDTSTPDVSPTDTSTPVDTSPPEPTCPLYQKLCGGVCVNTTVDPQHCGDCDTTCDAPAVCSAGGCASGCLTGLTACDGTCVDTQTDDAYCGSCSTECPPGQGCVSGSCKPSVPITQPTDCEDFGPIVVTVDGGDICLGDQAQTSFTWAICSCGGITTNNEIVTDAYDSRLGPYEPGGTGGGIGLNGVFSAINKLSIGGTLWASAASGSSVQGQTTIAHELHVGGPFYAHNVSSVGRDAFVVGHLSSNNGLSIAGTLHQPPGANVSGNVSYAARVNDQPVTVAPPCRCEPDELVPVAAIIAAHATDNDNAVVGLASNALINTGTDTHLALPCGRYYLDGISGSGKTTIIATGRAALFIAGDVVASNELQITVAPGAELDLFIGGTIIISNKLRLGSANFPAMMRVYVGSPSGLSLNNNMLVGAYLYVGNGPVATNNQMEIFGGLFGGSVSSNNKVTVHYDRAILGVGYDCDPQPPGETCSGCFDCGNQACVDGTCGACATSADCCSPLVCVEGQCLSLGIILDE